MSSWRRLIHEIFTGAVTEALGGLLVKHLPLLLATGLSLFALIVSWLKGWLFQELSIPVVVLVIWSLVLAVSPVAICQIRQYFRGRSLQEYYGVLWKIKNGKLQDGPFCPNDKRTLRVSQYRDSLQGMVASMKFKEQSKPYIVLECPQCHFRKQIEIEDLDHLIDDVQDCVAARKR